MREKIEARLAHYRDLAEGVVWDQALKIRIEELEWVLEQMPQLATLPSAHESWPKPYRVGYADGAMGAFSHIEGRVLKAEEE